MKNNMYKYLKQEKSNGKKVAEIIESSGIGRTSFYAIANSTQTPKLDTAIKIAKSLGTTVDKVFPQLKEVL